MNIFKIRSKNNECFECKRTEKQLVGNKQKYTHTVFNEEGLCIDCEIIIHSHRFHGCGFCKRPIRERFSCLICSSGFVEWIKSVIQPIDNLSMMLRLLAYKLVEIPNCDLTDENKTFIVRNDDGYYKWPGFYAGITNKFSFISSANANANTNKSKKYEYHDILDQMCDNEICLDLEIDKNTNIEFLSNDIQTNYFPVWIIPKLTKEYNFSYMELSLDPKIFQKILLKILEKNNIKLYSDIQIDLEKIQNIQIKTINSYDTRIMKKMF